MDVDLNLSVNIGDDAPSSLGTNSSDGEVEVTKPVNTAELKALEELLSVGSVIDSLDAVYALYCDYARLVGFSVKKGTQAYFTNTLVIRMKAFHCSCEGSSDDRRSAVRLTKYRKCITRSNCRARLRVIRDAEGPWRVSVFTTDHNHELFPPEYSYLLGSSRTLSLAQKSMLEVFKSRGIGVAKAITFMQKESGGSQNVGFTPRDAYSHMEKVNRKTMILDADADGLLKFFRDKCNSEPFFYWNYQRDDEGRLMNFFYRDARSKKDYEQFGDVLLIDTTYRTNKYNLICAPFVGLNHHRSNVIFGMGFLSDETTSTFEWLFSSFLESMNGCEPGVIFSDQSAPLMNGIDNVFQTAAHRLCQWHICQKHPKRFGEMNDDKSFKNLWHKCMNGCEKAEEFDQHWARMMEYEQYIDSKWFKKMYRLRRRWASVFTRDKFTAGIHATTRSECCNKVLKQCCTSSSTLTNFVSQYEELQRTWRQKEGECDALGVWEVGQVLPNCRLLCFAATVYTKSVFKLFEKQVSLSLCISIKSKPVDEAMENKEYSVFSSTAASGERRVKVNLQREEWSCSCSMWETDGIYCRHLIKILFWLNVYRIPEKHILDRWRKDARFKLFKTPTPPSTHTADQLSGKILFVSESMRIMYHLCLLCSSDPERAKSLTSRVNELVMEYGKRAKVPETEDEEALQFPDINVGEKMFKNPRKATGGWVPGKKRKASAKPKKKCMTTKKGNAPKATANPSRTKPPDLGNVYGEQPASSMVTAWRKEFNIPSNSQSVFINFDNVIAGQVSEL